MKYSLRSLMVVLLVLPPLLAGTWFVWQSVKWRFEPPPHIPYGGPPGIRGPHMGPNYNDREATRIMMKYEREHGPLKSIGN